MPPSEDESQHLSTKYKNLSNNNSAFCTKKDHNNSASAGYFTGNTRSTKTKLTLGNGDLVRSERNP